MSIPSINVGLKCSLPPFNTFVCIVVVRSYTSWIKSPNSFVIYSGSLR